MMALVTTTSRPPTETLLEGAGLTSVHVMENFPSLGKSCANAAERQLSGRTPAQTANVIECFIFFLPGSAPELMRASTVISCNDRNAAAATSIGFEAQPCQLRFFWTGVT